MYEKVDIGTVTAKIRIFRISALYILLENWWRMIYWRIEPTKSHDFTALTSCTNRRSINFGDILLFNTNYAFDCCNVKKEEKKAGPRENRCGILFYLFILLVNKLLLRTDAIPYVYFFIRIVLYDNNSRTMSASRANNMSDTSIRVLLIY